MSLKMSIQIQGVGKIKEFTDDMERKLEAGFEEALYFLLGESQKILDRGHTITGNLSRSGLVELSGFLKGTVSFTANYASFVQLGTRAHVIRAVRKLALRFKINDKTVIVKSVKHPGSVPVPFLYDYPEFPANLQKATVMVPKYLIKSWEELS